MARAPDSLSVAPLRPRPLGKTPSAGWAPRTDGRMTAAPSHSLRAPRLRHLLPSRFPLRNQKIDFLAGSAPRSPSKWILGHVAAAGQPGGSGEDRNISQRRLQPTGKAVLEWRAQTSWRPGVRVCQVPLPRLGSSLWVGLFHPGLTLRVHGAQIQLKSQVPHQLACVLGQSTLLLGLLTESPERAPARSPEH